MPQAIDEIKRQLKASNVTYDDVARLANVSWRMVHYVIHGQRKSRKVMNAIERLTDNKVA